MTGRPEAITRDELVAYYKRNTAANDTPADVARAVEACEHVADRILADVLAHREPEYEPGVLVVDDVGDVYRRCSEMARDMPWLGFGGHLHAEDAPVRPLRRLVRDGSQVARLSRESVVRALCAARNFEDDVEQTADRICKLLAASDEGTCPGGC